MGGFGPIVPRLIDDQNYQDDVDGNDCSANPSNISPTSGAVQDEVAVLGSEIRTRNVQQCLEAWISESPREGSSEIMTYPQTNLSRSLVEEENVLQDRNRHCLASREEERGQDSHGEINSI